jgi:hypothetical protein
MWRCHSPTGFGPSHGYSHEVSVPRCVCCSWMSRCAQSRRCCFAVLVPHVAAELEHLNLQGGHGRLRFVHSCAHQWFSSYLGKSVQAPGPTHIPAPQQPQQRPPSACVTDITAASWCSRREDQGVAAGFSPAGDRGCSRPGHASTRHEQGQAARCDRSSSGALRCSRRT